MKIAITGSTGFIGTHLKHHLTEGGYKVIEYTYSDKDALTSGALNLPPTDFCIHLASKVFIPDSWQYPFDYYKTNTMGTLAALEYCRKNNSHMIYFSSFVYATPISNPVSEDSPLGVSNPYSHSKLLAEELCQFYAKNFGVAVTILRPFNIYGPGQKENFLIPKIFEQALNPLQEKIELQTLTTKRDYLYVGDLCALVLKVFKTKTTGTFNVGSGVSTSVSEVAEAILKITNQKKEVISLGSPRKDDPPEIKADISKTSKTFNWKPEYNLNQGLTAIYEYSKKASI